MTGCGIARANPGVDPCTDWLRGAGSERRAEVVCDQVSLQLIRASSRLALCGGSNCPRSVTAWFSGDRSRSEPQLL